MGPSGRLGVAQLFEAAAQHQTTNKTGDRNMQTKNTNETGGKGGNSVQRGGTVIKSLSALGDAIKDGQIDEFALLVRKGIDTWRTAGKLLLDMTNKDPGAMKRIQERSGLSHSVLMTFARIGRNEIWPPLLVDNSLGSQRLQQCNYDEQKKYAAEPIEVAIEWRGEKIKTAKRTISELSRYECGATGVPAAQPLGKEGGRFGRTRRGEEPVCQIGERGHRLFQHRPETGRIGDLRAMRQKPDCPARARVPEWSRIQERNRAVLQTGDEIWKWTL
jgi:hypothetical protein